MSEAAHPPGKASRRDDGRLADLSREHISGLLHENNLPLKLTSFIGREREIAALKRVLAGETRLVTLTGAGGSGKTRLALAVANDLVEGFEDGAWWVELASLSDPDLVPQAVASTLGVREAQGYPLTQALSVHLGFRKMLLVLDNCEHLVDACATLSHTLLRTCPNLKILATSREALGVAGEITWLVPPLSVPATKARDPILEELGRYEAVRLFIERAKAVAPYFELTERNAAVVARVCRRLDGIPLAIELAAARVRVLSVEQIAQRLEDPLRFLTAGSRTAATRHRTLRATLQWSFDLLSAPERKLFGRLATFVGGFTLGAAEAICSGDGIEKEDILDLLSHLVEKSLVAVPEIGSEGPARYTLLEPIRQYALEQLEANEKVGEIRRKHAEYYLTLAEEAELELKRARQAEWLGQLERDHGNLRAALGWSIEGGDAALGLRLAGTLERFWWAGGHLSEGRRWLERGLAGSGTSPASVRAKALNEAGWMALWQDDLERAVALLEESVDLFKELGDEQGIATSLTNLGHAALHQDNEKRLAALREEAEALRREFSDQWAIAELLVFLGMVAVYIGDHEQAKTLLEQSMTSFRDLGDTQRATIGVTYLWMAELEGGARERAAALLREDLQRLRALEVKPQIQIYDDLMGTAVVAALGKQSARAVRLWAAAQALGEAISLSLMLWDHTPTGYEGYLVDARSRLGEAAWEAARNEGRAMSPEEAIEYALETEETAQSPLTETPSLLSAREVEVLRLVAEGLTDSQVAHRLYLSPRTVSQHLRSIYRKLGVPSRAAAAKQALERGLI